MSQSPSLPLSLTLYRLATYLLGPLAGLLLRARAQRGKEVIERLSERFGRTETSRPPGPLIWLHGASVGESLMLLTLIDAIRRTRPDLAVLVTTNTVTSATLMRERLPERCVHQFVPIDHPSAVRRFMHHWSPALAVFAESELWPNLLLECVRQDVRLALVNARMTQKSLDGWARTPAAARRILGSFHSILPADQTTAAGVSRLLGRTVPITGNLKQDAAPATPDEATLRSMRLDIGERPVWLAASTHPGEEKAALAAHRELLAAQPDRLLLLAPRHPERGADVTNAARALGLDVARRSAADGVTENTNVYVADTLGEMAFWFALADVALMAGSLEPNIGGHNPIEPALARTPIIVGPHTHNFADLYGELIASSGAVLARSSGEIAAAVIELEGPRGQSCAEAAHAIAVKGAGVLEKVLDELRPLLPEGADAGT